MNKFVNLPKNIPDNLDKMVTNVVHCLSSGNLLIATAESCTGGLLSELITSVAGASQVFECGVCTYANSMKEKLLGVSNETLKGFGAVSSQTALEMVQGLKKLSGADICVSVTGIAGPGGGTREKPVGTIYGGFIFGEEEFTIKFPLTSIEDKSRDSMRKHTALCVFYIVEELLKQGGSENK